MPTIQELLDQQKNSLDYDKKNQNPSANDDTNGDNQPSAIDLITKNAASSIMSSPSSIAANAAAGIAAPLFAKRAFKDTRDILSQQDAILQQASQAGSLPVEMINAHNEATKTFDRIPEAQTNYNQALKEHTIAKQKNDLLNSDGYIESLLPESLKLENQPIQPTSAPTRYSIAPSGGSASYNYALKHGLTSEQAMTVSSSGNVWDDHLNKNRQLLSQAESEFGPFVKVVDNLTGEERFFPKDTANQMVQETIPMSSYDQFHNDRAQFVTDNQDKIDKARSNAAAELAEKQKNLDMNESKLTGLRQKIKNYKDLFDRKMLSLTDPQKAHLEQANIGFGEDTGFWGHDVGEISPYGEYKPPTPYSPSLGRKIATKVVGPLSTALGAFSLPFQVKDVIQDVNDKTIGKEQTAVDTSGTLGSALSLAPSVGRFLEAGAPETLATLGAVGSGLGMGAMVMKPVQSVNEEIVLAKSGLDKLPPALHWNFAHDKILDKKGNNVPYDAAKSYVTY